VSALKQRRLPQLVEQRSEFDCSICCLAMLTEQTYEHVLEAVGDLYDPAEGMSREQEALRRLGYEWQKSFWQIHRGILDAKFFANMAWGRRAMVTVPSLNVEGGWHFVFVASGQVYDPSQKLRYGSFDELKPSDMILVDEGAH
jgi:hypothetical protein